MICSPSAVGLLRSLGVKWRRWGEWKGQGHGPRGRRESSPPNRFSPSNAMAGPERQSEVGRPGGALQAWRPSFLSPGLSSLPSAPPPRSEQSGLATSADPPARSADRARGRDQPTDRTAPPPPHQAPLCSLHSAPQPRPPASGHHYHFTGLNRGHTQIRGRV